MGIDWIWTFGEVKPHWAVKFRKVFNCDCDVTAKIRIAAENDCILYIDGEEIFRGINPEYYNNKSWTNLQYDFKSGKHVIAIWAYYVGEDFQTVVNSHSPGLFFEAKLSNGEVIKSDETWKCCEDFSLLRDQIDKVDFQLGFNFCFDNRLNDDYLSLEYDDSNWNTPQVFTYNGNFHARKINPMQKQAEVVGKLIDQGTFERNCALQGSYADIVAADNYSSKNPNGEYFIYDLGENFFGLIKLEIEAESGTIFDISHSEFLFENKVRAKVQYRNFTDRFISGGKNIETFILPRCIGGEFIQINSVNGKIKRLNVSLIPLKIELPEIKLAKSDNQTVNRLLESSKKTLELCMLEHYADCPWREQALYAGDSRWQMLFGYYLWGNYDYAAYNLEFLGESIRDNGLLAICAPCEVKLQITSFTIHWINAICEYTLYSNDMGVFERTAKLREKAVKALLARFDKESGLYYAPCDKNLWNFYEWEIYLDGLNGQNDAISFNHLGEFDEIDSVYNMLLIEMFKKLYQVTANEEYYHAAEKLCTTCRNYFYDKEQNYVKFYKHLDMKFEFVNSLAIYTEVVPQEKQADLIKKLMNDEFINATLSSLFYTVEVMANHSEESKIQLEKRLLNIFSPMLEDGKITTLWETADGAAAFDYSGSMCHGWSAILIYFYYKYIFQLKHI